MALEDMVRKPLKITVSYVPEADYWFAVFKDAPYELLQLSGTGESPLRAMEALWRAKNQ